MIPAYIELSEEPHLYIRDGKPLFAGRPDRVLYFPKQKVRIVLDRKFGRAEVPGADANMQLRAYLLMIPAETYESDVPQGYSEEFRPSSLLRFQLCPGSLKLQRQMTAQGLSGDGGGEDAAEGTRLHKAMSDPAAPRDDLTPEQFDTVTKAERMEQEFLDFVLGPANTSQMPFYGALIQPRVKGKADAAFYTEADIVAARAEIDWIYDKANREGASRRASADACKFCPCKAICPEYKSWVMAVEQLKHLPSAAWTPAQWNMFLERRGELQKFLDERYEDAKSIVALTPEAIPDWELEPGDKVRQVIDLPAAFAALNGVLSAKEFSDCCKFSFTQAETVLWRARSGTRQRLKHKECKDIINTKLADNIELKQKGPSLVKKKKKP